MVYFAPNISSIENLNDGGLKGHKRNLDALKKVTQVYESSYASEEKSFLQKVVNTFFSPAPFCFLPSQISGFKKEILKSGADIVFLDMSLLGKMAPFCKKHNKKVITFFHNVEAVYFEMKGKIHVRLARAAEKKALQFSDAVIVLNERDRKDLIRCYGNGEYEKKLFKIPVTYEDMLTTEQIENARRKKIHERPQILFLGANFKPNYEGVRWFVNNVMDNLDCDLKIVGRKFEDCRKELSRPNVEVIGGVDNTTQYLLDADFVIAPIFTGSGMKVKTAEALMCGKTIFGTSEAFEGYEIDYERVGGLCNTADQFIEKITNAVESKKIQVFNEYSRAIFLERYSNDFAVKQFSEVVGRVE